MHCQKLQDLANQLGDVDHPVSEPDLVLQLVCGLPKEYDVVGSLINQQNPAWDVARNMLELEYQRHSRVQSSSNVLLAQEDRHNTPNNQYNNNNSSRTTGYKGKNFDPNYQTNRGRGSYQRGRGNSYRGRGRGTPQQQNWQQQNHWNGGWNPLHPRILQQLLAILVVMDHMDTWVKDSRPTLQDMVISLAQLGSLEMAHLAIWAIWLWPIWAV